MNKNCVVVITSGRSNVVANSWVGREQAVKKFCEDLNGRLDGIRVVYTTYDDLVFQVSGQVLSVYDERNHIELSEALFVHFKNWEKNTVTAPVVARYLDHRGVPFANSVVMRYAPVGKLAQMFDLADKGLLVPETYHASHKKFIELANGHLPAPFKYPVIFKADNGSMGDDNFLAKSRAEFIDILSKVDTVQEFILQEFILNEGDFRYLFVGLDRSPLVFLRKGTGESHLNNTSQGGEGILQELRGDVEANASIARRAAAIAQKEIVGVDIIVDKNTKEVYVLELNGTPAIATGFAQNEKLDIFASFIADLAELEEEEE